MTETFAAAISLDLAPPKAPPFNLLTVADEIGAVLDGKGGIDPHWRAGAQLWPYPSELPSGEDPCVTGGSELKAEADEVDQDDLPTFGAFTIYQPIVCSTYATRDLAELERRANAALVAHEAWAVERQLASREFKVDNPALADSNMEALAGGGAVSPAEALALLENAIGETGERGVIHATPGTVAAWSVLGGAVVRERDRLFTLGGTPIVRGTGYIDVEPDDHTGTVTGDREWAFASSPVGYRRSEEIFDPETFSGLEIEVNRFVYRAERDYLVVWDLSLQAGVLVDRSL